ncbi:hypothetical protein Asera_05730 [Actinocatenispora sera]|uniref:Uncharacterized protein n=1 Tax=Actinocatenispora sera TaxID=390989 RepID=A0A810KUX0_9ACTN|nr:hypothetical protein Asera_05730 [Actinocatenispora sera]
MSDERSARPYPDLAGREHGAFRAQGLPNLADAGAATRMATVVIIVTHRSPCSTVTAGDHDAVSTENVFRATASMITVAGVSGRGRASTRAGGYGDGCGAAGGV